MYNFIHIYIQPDEVALLIAYPPNRTLPQAKSTNLRFTTYCLSQIKFSVFEIEVQF